MASSRIAQIIDDVQSNLNFPIFRDARELYSTNDAPRVVAVAQGGAITSSDRVGGNPRQILLRNCGVKFYCWHQDEQLAEDMLHSTLAAVRKATHNSVEFTDETWEDQQENADGFERRGKMISFEAIFTIPVFDVVLPIAKILDWDHETLFNGAIYDMNSTYGNCVYGSSTLFTSCAA